MLDSLGERELFYRPIAKLATLTDKGRLNSMVSPISFATVNYFLTKNETPEVEGKAKKIQNYKQNLQTGG